MPVFDYECAECNGRFEEIVLCGEQIEETLPCVVCSKPATRIKIYSFSCNGLEDHQLDSMEKMLFTKKQRAAAYKMRQSDNPVLRDRGNEFKFRTNSDLRRHEESKGWRRLTPGTAEYKRNTESMLDDESDIRNTTLREGREAGADLIIKREVTEKNGCSSSQYDRWKSMTDKVSQNTEVTDA